MFITKQRPTQNESKTSITINGYKIDINAKKKNDTAIDSYFSTSFDIIDSYNYKNTYWIDFVDLILTSKNTNEMNYNDTTYGNIKINGKLFYYVIDKHKWNATLYYTIPNDNAILIIKIRGGNIFDSNNNQLKTLAIIDKEILESSELAKILEFSIKKF